MWWKGPPFLQSLDAQWPINPVQEMNDEVQTELVKNQLQITSSLVNTSGNSQLSIEEIIDINRYSNLNRLLRVTSYVIRFINLCRSRGNTPPTLAVTTTEKNEVEALWIKAVQHKSIYIEFSYLKESTSSPPLCVEQFGLYLDDGITKCKGRINNSTLSLQSRNPILLPSSHRFTELLILQSHSKAQHSGVNDTLVLLRERYWILKGRQAERKVCKSCITCKRLQGACYPTVPSPH